MTINWLKITAGGPVSHAYEIMYDPVTNEQYCGYLNALPPQEAVKRYCPLMEQHFFGGIMRDYTPKPGFANKPVVFVSWLDAQAFGAWAGTESVGGRT